MDKTEMELRLEEARARRRAQIEMYTKKEAEKEAATNFSANQASASFPWRELQPGDEVMIRFVADPDTNNQNFWRTLCSRRLQFKAIRQPDGSVECLGQNQTYDVFVPAWNMKKNETAVDDLTEEYLFSSTEDPLQPLVPYSDPKEGDVAAQEFFRKYRKQETNIYYGFVMKADNHPDWVGKLYRFMCGKSIHTKISSVMKDTEIEEIVTELDFGHDFKLCCSMKGQYKNYEQDSKFMYKPTALPESLRKVLEDAHIPEFKTLINKKPTPEQCELMLKAFRAATSDGVFESSWAKAWDKLVGFGWKVGPNGFLETTSTVAGSHAHTEIPEQTTTAPMATVLEKVSEDELPWAEKETQVEQPIPAFAGNAQIKVAAPVELPADMAKLVKAAPTPGDVTAKKEVELNIVSGAPVTQPKEVERVGVAVPTPAVAATEAPATKPADDMRAILGQLGINLG